MDQAVRVAVEAYAMNKAMEHFSDDWDVIDVHSSHSFDLKCLRTGCEKHVEVKGTTSSGEEVILTPNEVDHARGWPDMALFVLANISVEYTGDGGVEAAGGSPIVLDPWSIDAGTLRPVGYRYSIPHRQQRGEGVQP